jgi:hypothetical protein
MLNTQSSLTKGRLRRALAGKSSNSDSLSASFNIQSSGLVVSWAMDSKSDTHHPASQTPGLSLPDRVAALFPSDIAFLGNESFTWGDQEGQMQRGN